MGNKNSKGAFFGGILIGSAVGAVMGILFAPRTGKENRKILKKSAEALPELAEDLATTLKLQTHHLSEKTQQKWAGTMTRLQDAIAAGIHASQSLELDDEEDIIFDEDEEDLDSDLELEPPESSTPISE